MPYTRIGPFTNGAAPYLNAENLDRLDVGVQNATATAEAAMAAATASSGLVGAVTLDSFSGSTDDDKLTNALSYAAAQSQIPAVVMPTTRVPTFNQGGRTAFSGMKIVGGPGGNRNPELAGGKYVSSMVRLRCGNGTSSWFVGSGSIYNVYVANIGFNGSSNTQFWHHPASGGTLYSCRFESLGFDLFKHVFGTPSAPIGFTQVELTGHWTANNAWDQQFTIGGSDNQLWFDGYINMGTGQSAALAGDNTKWYMHFSGLSNTQVGYTYLSGLNGYNCLRVSGNSDGLHIFAPVLEGYKATGTAADGTHTLANPGNVLRLEGGSGAVYGGNFGQAMAQAPSGHNGVIQITGGEWNFYSPNFYKGAMAESVPMIHQSGGRVAVFAPTRRQSESWTARPGYKTTGGTFDLWPTSSMTALT